MATPTGFSINSMISIIRDQEPNIDKEDAKQIAEQIKQNLLNSLVGKRTSQSSRRPPKKKEEKSKEKETYRTPDGQYSSFNKMVESNLKEIRTDIKKGLSSVSVIEKGNDEIKKNVEKIIDGMQEISERTNPEKTKKTSEQVEKPKNEEAERLTDLNEVIRQIEVLKKQNDEILDKVDETKENTDKISKKISDSKKNNDKLLKVMNTLSKIGRAHV